MYLRNIVGLNRRMHLELWRADIETNQNYPLPIFYGFGGRVKRVVSLFREYCVLYPPAKEEEENVVTVGAYARTVANAKSRTPKYGDATAVCAFASTVSKSLTRFSILDCAHGEQALLSRPITPNCLRTQYISWPAFIVLSRCALSLF
jgi:hypothetical protein